MFDTAESALVLFQTKVSRGEAARGKRQRHAAPHHDLRLQARRAFLQQARQRLAVHFQRNHEAGRAAPGQPFQGAAMVGVHVRAGYEGTPGQMPHGAHLPGLDHEILLFAQLLQGAGLGAGLDQRAAGQHHRLAGGAQVARKREPILGA
ncbi:hypothetical protein D9M68_657960 [compost metagenome]